jgi:hypothetical protein
MIPSDTQDAVVSDDSFGDAIARPGFVQVVRLRPGTVFRLTSFRAARSS